MHAPRKDFKDLLKAHAAPGEPYVWLTSMGLAIGLLMVVGLLGVIVTNGLPVFWPSRVVAVKLKEGVTGPVPNSPVIIGEIAQERTKSVKVLGADGKPAADQKEIQLFVGNKDTYGFSFAFLDSSSIASLERPKNILLLERVEYGDAFGTPVALQFSDGQRMEAGSPDFDSTLQKLIRDGNARRAKIEQIEKIEIGRINARMTGQMQRICIARAIANRPEILLMDEPCSALDPIATAKVEELIHELKKVFTIVIVTHNMQQATRCSDRTAFFYLGKLIEANSTPKIFEKPSEKQTEDYITGRFG